MPVATVKASSSTWVRESVPNANYARGTLLAITEGTAGQRGRAYTYFAPKISPTAVVSAATLTLYLKGPSTGWGAVTVRRCTSRIADSLKTWNRQPGLGAASAPVTPSGTVADGTAITFDLTALTQSWVNGGLPNYGLEVQNAGTTSELFYSATSSRPPVLTITYSTPPGIPHNLAPNGVCGVAKPTVTFGPYTDVDGDALQAVQVQTSATTTGFSTTTGFVSAAFDSGWVAATSPQLDLSTATGQTATLSAALSTGAAITSLPVTATSQPIASGVTLTITSGANTQPWVTTAAAASGATTIAVTSQIPNFAYPIGSLVAAPFSGFTGTAAFWAVRVKDGSGAISSFSDPASVTYVAKPSVALSSPSSGTPHVFEATPQIVWTCTGMTAFKAQILDGITRAVLADSGHVSSATGQWGVPISVIQPGGTYIAAVFAWDQNRSASPGDPSYSYAEQTFDFTPGTAPAPTALSAAPGLDWPGQVALTWTQAAAPDYFTLYMDGNVLKANLAPGDAVITGTTYGFSNDYCPAGEHTFKVDAVTAGVATLQSASVMYMNTIDGIWLGDPVRKIWAMITSGSDTSVDGLKMTDNATLVQTIDGTIPQVVIRGMNGLGTNGSPLTGHLSPKATALSVEQRAANLMTLKGSPQTTLRLVMGPYNIPVKVWNISVGPSTNHSTGASWRNVSFEFMQVGEFGFKANL